MISLPETKSMASAATPGPAVNCSYHAADGGASDVAFTAGVITVAAAFCVISVVSLCHCVRHALVGGGARKATNLDTLFYTEDEVEMAELRHFPMPHTGQVPRVRTPPSPSPSPMKFLMSPLGARLSQTRLMSSRALASGQPAPEQEPARLTRSLPSLHTLPGGWAPHGAVEHYVEMALVSAMTASSSHELQALAPEPDPTKFLVPPPPPPPVVPSHDSSRHGRRRQQRKRYPPTPLPRGTLVAVSSAPPASSHGAVDTDYQSAYAPSQVTDSDEQTTTAKNVSSTAAAAAPKYAGSKAPVTAGRASTPAERAVGGRAQGWLASRMEGSELILVSRRALERLLRRPLSAAELHVGGPEEYRDRSRNRDRRQDRDQGMSGDRERERDNTVLVPLLSGLSGLQPLESSVVVNESSRAVRSETAGVLADTEDTLGDTVGTLGETGPLGDTFGTLEETGMLEAIVDTLGETIETLGDTVRTREDTVETLGDTEGTTEEQRRGWIPEPSSPEWDPSAEPRLQPLPPLTLAVSPRSHSIV